MKAPLIASCMLLAACSPSPEAEKKLPVVQVQLSSSAHTLSVLGSSSLDGKEPVQFKGAVNIEPASDGRVDGQKVGLVASKEGTPWAVNPNPWLGHRQLSDLKVYSGSKLLKENQDYYPDYSYGKLNGARSLEKISLSYAYRKERYDLVYVELASGEVKMKQGVERDIDASEYLPVASDGELPVAAIYVSGSDFTVVPTYRFYKGAPTFKVDSAVDLSAHNNKALAKTRKLLRDGKDITVVGYGDSFTAVGGGRGIYSPNGQYRDVSSSMPAVQRDTRSTWQHYDFADGAGTIHAKVSYVWTLVQDLEHQYAGKVNYLNFSGSATSSAATEQNGLWPDRLKPVLSSNANVMILAFGMNEIGSKDTQANVRNIVKHAKSAGMDVVVMAVSKPNPSNSSVSESAWTYTNAALRAAALEAGAAFCDTTLLTEGVGGGLPLAPQSLSAGNLFNLPGSTEHRAYGEFLSQMF